LVCNKQVIAHRARELFTDAATVLQITTRRSIPVIGLHHNLQRKLCFWKSLQQNTFLPRNMWVCYELARCKSIAWWQAPARLCWKQALKLENKLACFTETLLKVLKTHAAFSDV